MRVIVLGSAAGGGVPQWNCGCPNCRAARERGLGLTQSSVAVSADDERWILLNASPDLRAQCAAHPVLWPPAGCLRGTPIRAVVLTDGELREVGGAGGGVEAPTAREMGHLPVGDPGGSIELLPKLGAKRTVLVHINNTNPILRRASAERLRVEAAGIEVGEDGMEFEL